MRVVSSISASSISGTDNLIASTGFFALLIAVLPDDAEDVEAEDDDAEDSEDAEAEAAESDADDAAAL